MANSKPVLVYSCWYDSMVGIEQDGYLFDGNSKRMAINGPGIEAYATCSIERITSLLPTVSYRCELKYINESSIFAPDQDRTLLLAETDDPLLQILRYANHLYHNVECRIILDNELAFPSTKATAVSLSGADFNDIQWIYCGNTWTEEEMLPLEEMLHQYMNPLMRNYWELIKREHTQRMKYYYYVRQHMWDNGWIGDDTLDGLARKLEEELKKG